MSQVPVVYPVGTSTPIKAVIQTDETGTVNVQVVQLGLPDQGQMVVDLLTQILNELKALRIQNAQAGNLPYEPTSQLIDSTQN